MTKLFIITALVFSSGAMASDLTRGAVSSCKNSYTGSTFTVRLFPTALASKSQSIALTLETPSLQISNTDNRLLGSCYNREDDGAVLTCLFTAGPEASLEINDKTTGKLSTQPYLGFELTRNSDIRADGSSFFQRVLLKTPNGQMSFDFDNSCTLE